MLMRHAFRMKLRWRNCRQEQIELSLKELCRFIQAPLGTHEAWELGRSCQFAISVTTAFQLSSHALFSRRRPPLRRYSGSNQNKEVRNKKPLFRGCTHNMETNVPVKDQVPEMFAEMWGKCRAPATCGYCMPTPAGRLEL